VIAPGPQRPPSILWFRWVGLGSLLLALASFFAAAIAQWRAPESPATRPLVWVAVGLFLFCLVALPGLLIRAMRVRRLSRKEWRPVVARAVWGGPFGTLGALWDLTADPDEGRPGERE
jgi:hypothetical protein